MVKWATREWTVDETGPCFCWVMHSSDIIGQLTWSLHPPLWYLCKLPTGRQQWQTEEMIKSSHYMGDTTVSACFFVKCWMYRWSWVGRACSVIFWLTRCSFIDMKVWQESEELVACQSMARQSTGPDWIFLRPESNHNLARVILDRNSDVQSRLINNFRRWK